MLSYRVETPDTSRTLKVFDRVYADSGGVGGYAQMKAMAERFDTLQQMADHFGFARERASQLVRLIVGMPYSQYLKVNKISRAGVRRDQE